MGSIPNTCSRLVLVSVLAALAACPGIAAAADPQAAGAAELAARGQREAKNVTFGDWRKVCFKAGITPRLCRTSIDGKFPTGQTAVRIDLVEREGAPAARLQIFLPIGMYLQQPPKLTVDQGNSQSLPYGWCLTNMCIAADVADPKLIGSMESGKTLALEVVDSNLLTVTAQVSLAQFASVHKGEPARTLEPQTDE